MFYLNLGLTKQLKRNQKKNQSFYTVTVGNCRISFEFDRKTPLSEIEIKKKKRGYASIALCRKAHFVQRHRRFMFQKEENEDMNMNSLDVKFLSWSKGK